MGKDEVDLYADIKWLEIQYDYFEAQKTRIEKEIRLLEELKIIRNFQYESSKKKVSKKVKEKIDKI